jgi:hypothetical protein
MDYCRIADFMDNSRIADFLDMDNNSLRIVAE